MPPKPKSTQQNKPAQPKPTSERITLKGEKKPRVVYVGPRGGKYLKKDGEFVALTSMPKSGKKAQKGGNGDLAQIRNGNGPIKIPQEKIKIEKTQIISFIVTQDNTEVEYRFLNGHNTETRDLYVIYSGVACNTYQQCYWIELSKYPEDNFYYVEKAAFHDGVLLDDYRKVFPLPTWQEIFKK